MVIKEEPAIGGYAARNSAPFVFEIVKDFVDNNEFDTSFLDLGCGSGYYIRSLREQHGNKVVLIGVEIYADYIKKPLLEDVDRIYRMHILDALELMKEAEVDISFMGDVLEHFWKRDAKKVIEKLKLISKIIIISVPLFKCYQGYDNPNKYETHLSQWTEKELNDLGFKSYKMITYEEWVSEEYEKDPTFKPNDIVYGVFLWKC